MRRFYFDWAATAADCGAVGDGAAEAGFANPSSIHAEGRRARQALEDARRRCAAALGAAPETVYWTSGGSESNSIPLFARLLAPAGAVKTARLAAGEAEHPSISRPLETLARLGVPVSAIPLAASGHIEEAAVARLFAAAPETGFVSIQAVNGETGAAQPLERLVRRVRAEAARPVHIHSDCVQALGKLPLNVGEAGLDSASFSAHKIGGPRGMGLLYLRKPLDALIKGGGQEGGIRPGTENVAGARDFALRVEACAEAGVVARHYAEAARRANRLLQALGALEGCTILPRGRGLHAADSAAESAEVLRSGGYSPYIVAASFRNVPGEVMVRALDEAGFAISAGAACSHGAKKKQTLEALGIDSKTALETIRISQGFTTKDEDVELLINAITRVYAALALT